MSASLLSQFISLTIAPSGTGETGHVRFALNSGSYETLDNDSKAGCLWEGTVAGDARRDLTGPREAAAAARSHRENLPAASPNPLKRLRP